MILLGRLYIRSVTDLYIYLGVSVLAICIPFVLLLYSNKKREKDILEAEKKRKACPDIQSGRFTTLYTMPYYEKLNEQAICAYGREKYPNYFYTVSNSSVRVSETRSGLLGEIRNLTITHLPKHDITAISIHDPHEVEMGLRSGAATMRSCLDDKGFSKDVREIIRHFQSEALKQ